MIQLPNNKKCYNLPEQVAQNLLNIQYLAEQYKNIDELPAIWQSYKETFDAEQETFAGWTTTFEGWDTTLATYLVNMSSAAVSAIAGQNIAPADITASGNITGPSIIENMTGYTAAAEAPATNTTNNIAYCSVCKNGNKVTFVCAGTIVTSANISADTICNLVNFSVPSSVGSKIYTIMGNQVAYQSTSLVKSRGTYKKGHFIFNKNSNTAFYALINFDEGLETSTTYYYRMEFTFLLNDSLI